jgi:hypothetical protein
MDFPGQSADFQCGRIHNPPSSGEALPRFPASTRIQINQTLRSKKSRLPIIDAAASTIG